MCGQRKKDTTMDRTPKLPSDKLKEPPRPWVTVGIVAASAVIISGAGVGAYALTHSSGPTIPRVMYEVAANSAPAAVITATSSNLTVTVDGSSSTDADGAIVDYAWDFGDGTTATEATASHAYASAGDYTITLTVHDDGEHPASGTASTTVSVSTPPPPPPPAAPAAGAPGSLVPFVASSDPNNALGGDYIDPGIYCQSGSASGNPPRCD
jgi:PKD repeat protein